MPNDKEGCVCLVEQGDVENAAVLRDEFLQANPLVLVHLFVYHVDFFIVCCKTDFLLELAQVLENVHFLGVKLLLIVIGGAHQVSVDLQLELQMSLVHFSVRRHEIEIVARVAQDFYVSSGADLNSIVALGPRR